MPFGPFDVTAAQIVSLGVGFTEFINRLLDVEVASHGIDGHDLVITKNDTTPDGGVDAALHNAVATAWLPKGNSVWQFKRSNFGPKACADELEGAKWAQEYVKAGGSYVIVVGADLNDTLVENRRKAVAKKAIALKLINKDDPGRIRVYDANQIARWVSRYPGLAVSRLLGGPGMDAVDFDYWSATRTHQVEWVADAARQDAIATIRSLVAEDQIVEVRIQGESGIGKTRLVLESVRTPEFQPLVAYVADERSVDGDLLAHLVEPGRTAILVVDECPADRHVKLVERLPQDPGVKLITIGDSGAAASRTPVIILDSLGKPDTEKLLEVNYRQLSPEARRFVADHSRGNARWTFVLAERVANVDAAQAAELIERNDIEQFVVALLPEGSAFFYSAVLALLERVGWDRDLRPQLEILARFAGAAIEEIIDAGRALEQSGLLVQQGRYRSVSPHPLAVYLAAEAWRTEGDRILSELLPELDDEMSLALFRRVAELGRFEPALAVLPRLIASTGPFGSIESIDSNHLGKMLTQLAIVMPEQMALHLGELIEAASVDDLRARTGARRDLVWTLEKLVWHRSTFNAAADSLLRLAIAENETFGNNATGSWLSLFGTLLPGTAATPRERSDYLAAKAKSSQAVVRAFAAEGCSKALAHLNNETIMVSGELQGGVLVEPRGMPATWDDAGEYRRVAIKTLRALVDDPDPAVAQKAADWLIGAVHPMLDDPLAAEALIDALTTLSGDNLTRLRQEVAHTLSLYERSETEGRDTLVERLRELGDALPEASDLEELRTLLQLRQWDLPDGELQRRIATVLRRIPTTDFDEVFGLLGGDAEVPAAWELGYALAGSGQARQGALAKLRAVFAFNSAALVGYLRGLVDSGDEAAFDSFLDSDLASGLELAQQTAIAVRGPATSEARNRILSSVLTLPVAAGIYALFGWQKNIDDSVAGQLLADWLARIDSQEDYVAVIDWLNLWLHGRDQIPATMQDNAYALLLLRRSYPEISRQRWAWWRISGAFVAAHGVELARLILDLIDSHDLTVLEQDQESQLLRQCAGTHPTEMWTEIANRISGGAWRIQMTVRGWLASSIPADVIEAWVGSDRSKARIVASIAATGLEEPTPIARFLLSNFPRDDQVRSSLAAEFVSGGWVGNESERIAKQIKHLNDWRSNSNEPLEVRRWAKAMVDDLDASLAVVLEREAERGY
jgi:hypothetical protein